MKVRNQFNYIFANARRRFKSREIQRLSVIIVFLFVPVVLLLAFTYIPFAEMVRYSFFKWNGTSPNMEYIGLDNYKQIFTERQYFQVFKTSLYYLAGSIIQIALALYFATILNYRLKLKNLFKGILFFPYLINGVAIGFIFMYFFREQGTLDTLLAKAGIPSAALPLWLGNVKIINISLTGVSIWRYMGQNMVMFIGAIQSVSTELYEASGLDGANRWQQFRYIILPNIRPIVNLNLILAVKGAINVFEIPYIMTSGGNGSATFVIKAIQMAFTNKKIGLASAMGVILLIIIMIITYIQKYCFEAREEK